MSNYNFWKESFRSWYFWVAVLVTAGWTYVVIDAHNVNNLYIKALEGMYQNKNDSTLKR